MHSVSLDLAKGQHPASRTANSDIACAKHGRFPRVFQLAAFAIILLPCGRVVAEFMLRKRKPSVGRRKVFSEAISLYSRLDVRGL
jgi:hypothetical protein